MCSSDLYREFGTDRLVGFKIKNVRVLLSRFDALGLSYNVSKSQKKWSILLQPLLAYIPIAVEPTTEQASQYRDVLTSFGDRLNTPVDVSYA